MPVLHIEHEISELAVWLDAFNKMAPAREAAGVTRTEVYRPNDDPNYVVINLSFDNLDAATTFREFLINQIWASPNSAPALVGPPTARVLEEVQL
ncbi:MAG TPA: hypothetical protein VGP27_14000 [Mycobacterium sp.]|jgi:hypothetical protein|nr:hypothetical protein [Mycobacterium sp.]